jgi:hypothetical protein
MVDYGEGNDLGPRLVFRSHQETWVCTKALNVDLTLEVMDIDLMLGLTGGKWVEGDLVLYRKGM